MASTKAILRRYTDMPALLDVLSMKRITLLDPRSWDDKNDSYFLELYRKRLGLKSVLALCFTRSDERYGHWRVFTSGSNGVCICFSKDELLAAIEQLSPVGDLRHEAAQYFSKVELKNASCNQQQIPFLKRKAFEDEREYRLVHGSKDVALSKLDLAIPLSCIDRIVLSPWLHRDLFDSAKRTLTGIRDCSRLQVKRSVLIGDDEWKSIGDKIGG